MKRLSRCLDLLVGKLLTPEEVHRLRADAEEYTQDGRTAQEAERMAAQDALDDIERNFVSLATQMKGKPGEAALGRIVRGEDGEPSLFPAQQTMVEKLKAEGVSAEDLIKAVPGSEKWRPILERELAAPEVALGAEKAPAAPEESPDVSPLLSRAAATETAQRESERAEETEKAPEIGAQTLGDALSAADPADRAEKLREYAEQLRSKGLDTEEKLRAASERHKLGNGKPFFSDKQIRELLAAMEQPKAAEPPPEKPAPKREPSEPSSNPTSIKNRQTDMDRLAMGHEPRPEVTPQSFKEWDEKSEAILKANPEAGAELVERLIRTRDRPSAVDQAVLAKHRAGIMAKYQKATDEVNAAYKSGDMSARDTAAQRREVLEAQLKEAGDVIVQYAGTEVARSLVARKMYGPSEWDLDRMMGYFQASKGGAPLTEGEKENVRAAFQKIQELEAEANKTDEHKAKDEQRVAIDAEITKLKEELAAERAEKEKLKAERAKTSDKPTATSRVVSSIKQKAQAAREWLKARAGLSAAAPKDSLSAADPGELNEAEAYAAIGAEYIEEGADKFEDWQKKMVGEFGDGIKKKLQSIWRDARALVEAEGQKATGKTPEQLLEKMQARLKGGDELKQLRPYVRELERSIIGGNLNITREKLIDAVHGHLAKIIPGFTREQTYEIVSGLGIYRELSKEPEDVVRRRIEGESQQIAKLDKLKAGELPPKTGMQRREKSDEERWLEREYKEALKTANIQVTDPESQLKTALDAIETRLKNSIRDLATEIDLGGKRKAPNETPTNDRIEALRALRDRLRETLEAVRGKPEMTPEQRVKAAVKAVQKSIELLQKRMQSDDFLPKEKATGVTSPELETLRADRKALAQEFRELRMLDSAFTAQQEAKKVAKLEKSIADLDAKLQSGDLSTKGKTGAPNSVAVEGLKAERAEMLKLLAQERAKVKRPAATPEELALQRWRTRTAQRTAEFERRKAAGDFAAKAKPEEPMLTPADLKAKANLERAKQDFMEAAFNAKLKARTRWQKLLSLPVELLNTARAIFLSVDLSAIGRQGDIALFTRAKLVAKAFGPMFQALKSEAGQDLINAQLHARENVVNGFAKRAGLFFAERGSSLAHMEEVYRSRLAKYIPLVSHSERAYTTFLNWLRADLFDTLLKSYSGEDKKAPSTEVLKAIGHYINVVTGRGDFGKYEVSRKFLGIPFLAPGWVLSRFQYLMGTPLWKAMGTKDQRLTKLIAKEYGRMLIGLGAIVGAGALLGIIKSLDPRSSNFLKMQLGANHTVDILGGLAQPLTLASRLASGKTVRADGSKVPIRGPDKPFGGTSAQDVVWNFMASKAAPVPRLGLDIASGEHFGGEPVTPGSIVKHTVIPLTPGEVVQQIQQDGWTPELAVQLVNLLGFPVAPAQYPKYERQPHTSEYVPPKPAKNAVSPAFTYN